MTTMELIERGIGHNCLSDAYDLGRAEAIEPIMRGIDDFRTLERKMCKYFNEVDIHKEKDDLERLALDIVCHGMQTIGCLIQELDLINYQAKEQKDEM